MDVFGSIAIAHYFAHDGQRGPKNTIFQNFRISILEQHWDGKKVPIGYLQSSCARRFLQHHNEGRNNNEPPQDKTNKMVSAPSEDSDQPSLIRVFTVRMKKAWFLSYPLSAQRILIFAGRKCHFVGFVMRRLSHVYRKSLVSLL